MCLQAASSQPSTPGFDRRASLRKTPRGSVIYTDAPAPEGAQADSELPPVPTLKAPPVFR
jgi:hypothetical protein